MQEHVPLLTIVIAAYNAEAYMRRAIEPLLRIPRDLEVIIVDDGSMDATATVSAEYAARRPDMIRAVSQPNAGHGGAIQTGLDLATGEYLKVLDADDWISIPALEQVLAALRDLADDGGVDALFTDYVHDRMGKQNRVSRFESVFPSRQVFGWDRTERFGARQYLMMHAIVFRTRLVRDSGLRLPHHTYYVDSLYVVVPLVHVRRMFYLPVSLYHYFIGRADQSVNADMMLARVDQQLKVNRLALDALPSPGAIASGAVPSQLYSALLHYAEALCAVTSATLASSGTREHLEQRAQFWRDLRHENPRIYAQMRHGFMGASSNLPGHAGRRVTTLAYQVARRVVGFS